MVYKKHVTMVSMDVEFNHNILLDKLAHYGVRVIKNNWFKTHLTNRKQHATVSGQTSDNALIESLGSHRVQFWIHCSF